MYRGSTSGLKKHLEGQHSVDMDSDTKKVSGPPIKKQEISTQRNITELLKPQMTLRERLARYAAIDGFTPLAIARFKQIHYYLRSKRLEPPKSHNTVIKHIMTYYDVVLQQTRDTILKLRRENCFLFVENLPQNINATFPGNSRERVFNFPFPGKCKSRENCHH